MDQRKDLCFEGKKAKAILLCNWDHLIKGSCPLFQGRGVRPNSMYAASLVFLSNSSFPLHLSMFEKNYKCYRFNSHAWWLVITPQAHSHIYAYYTYSIAQLVLFLCVCVFFSGNVIGRQPYESGTSCSACLSDLPVCRENLCSPGQAPPTSSEAPLPATTEAPPSPSPPGGKLSEMSKEEILRAHNHVRSLVSPSATNMRRLVSSMLLIQICIYGTVQLKIFAGQKISPNSVSLALQNILHTS